jgi:hypothetical protein
MEFRGEVPRIPRAGLIGSTVFAPVFHRRQCISNEIGLKRARSLLLRADQLIE